MLENSLILTEGKTEVKMILPEPKTTPDIVERPFATKQYQGLIPFPCKSPYLLKTKYLSIILES